MSYVITVQRPEGKPSLSASDVERLLEKDTSLSRLEDGALVWTCPEGRHRLHINVEADHLWSDGVRGQAADAFLAKLREIAGNLEARLIGEEGEDLTAEEFPEGGGLKQSLMAILGLAATVVALPFIVALLILRIPWVLWKICRTK